MWILLAIIGAATMMNGVSVNVAAESAMHQIIGAVYVTGGLLLIGLSVAAYGLRSATAKLEEIRKATVDKAPAA